jgi:hypothetical protein
MKQVLFDDLQLDKQCAKKLSKTSILKHKSTSESVVRSNTAVQSLDTRHNRKG